MSQFKKFKIKTVDAREKHYGFIELDEYGIDLPIRKVYYIHGSTGPTGQHAHHVEEEVFVMLKGSSTAVIDQGNGKEEIVLEAGDAIYAPQYVWHGFKDFADPESVILALSSEKFKEDRSDYIEDYDQYLTLRDQKLKK